MYLSFKMYLISKDLDKFWRLFETNALLFIGCLSLTDKHQLSGRDGILFKYKLHCKVLSFINSKRPGLEHIHRSFSYAIPGQVHRFLNTGAEKHDVYF